MKQATIKQNNAPAANAASGSTVATVSSASEESTKIPGRVNIDAVATTVATAAVEDNVRTMTIKELAEVSGLSLVYIRRAILTGKLPSEKVQYGNTNIMQHIIRFDDYENWRKAAGTRSRRSDGRSKYTLYGTPEEVEKIQALLKAQAADELAETIVRAPVYKSKKAAADAE